MEEEEEAEEGDEEDEVWRKRRRRRWRYGRCGGGSAPQTLSWCCPSVDGTVPSLVDCRVVLHPSSTPP